jgi:peptidoglycan/xylan/chitin deacetylase (PgdA/CDA1 family)
VANGLADRTSILTLTVTELPDFSLSANPVALSIEQGGNDTVAVTLVRMNFTGEVQLTVENAPAGVNASFNPTSTTGDASTLSITVGVAVALGEYSLTVRGVATGIADRTVTLTLTVISELKVAFRLDDIQAHWCATTATEVTQMFVDKGIPLTLGIVGGDPWYVPRIDMGPDTPGGMLINRFKNEALIQIVSHSYNHTNLTTLTEQQQRQDFEDQQRVLESFGITTVAFIPPENAYDATTVSLMKDFGMNVLCAQCTWSSDQPPLAISCPTDDQNPDQPVNGLTHIPAGAVLGDNTWEDPSSPMSWPAAQDWATRQLNAQQFSVFMIHPQELTSDGACTTDAPDSGKMATLNEILNQAVLAWSLLSLEEMNEYIISR